MLLASKSIATVEKRVGKTIFRMTQSKHRFKSIMAAYITNLFRLKNSIKLKSRKDRVLAEKGHGGQPDTARLDRGGGNGEAYAERHLCLIQYHQGIAEEEVDKLFIYPCSEMIS